MGGRERTAGPRGAAPYMQLCNIIAMFSTKHSAQADFLLAVCVQPAPKPKRGRLQRGARAFQPLLVHAAVETRNEMVTERRFIIFRSSQPLMAYSRALCYIIIFRASFRRGAPPK